MTSDGRMLIRAFVNEVTHPAIDREKAQQATPTPTNQRPGEAQPVAATKISSAKTTGALNGYRVTTGSKKGTAIGHEGELTTVKWDDGTTTQEQGTAIRDLREYVRLCMERMDSLVVDLERPGGGSDKPVVTHDVWAPTDPVDDEHQIRDA